MKIQIVYLTILHFRRKYIEKFLSLQLLSTTSFTIHACYTSSVGQCKFLSLKKQMSLRSKAALKCSSLSTPSSDMRLSEFHIWKCRIICFIWMWRSAVAFPVLRNRSTVSFLHFKPAKSTGTGNLVDWNWGRGIYEKFCST